MKRLFTILFILTAYLSFAQVQILFSEDFEGDGLPGWSVGDLDGDGNNWELVFSSEQAEAQGWGPDMTLMLGSFGYSLLPGNEQPLYPDNIIITPNIILPEGGNINMNFLLGTNVEFMNDHNFALYILENTEDFSVDMIPFFEMNFEGISTAQEVSLDLSEFSGTTIQIVLRHYNSDEQFVLLIDDILITQDTQMSINESNTFSKISLYPNPVHNLLYLKNVQDLKNVKIYDVLGKLILSSESPNIDVSRLPSGVYFLRIFMDKTITTKKFIKY